MSEMTRVTLRLPRSLLADVETLAAEAGYAHRSAVLRDAIRRLVQGDAPAEGPAPPRDVRREERREIAARLAAMDMPPHRIAAALDVRRRTVLVYLNETETPIPREVPADA